MQNLTSGSVCTITSATSGLARRSRSSTSLAQACASASVEAGSSPSVRKATTPFSVRRSRSSRGARRRRARPRPRSRPPRRARQRRPRRAARGGSARTPISGTEPMIARSTCSAISCAWLERQVAGQLQVERQLGARPSETTLRLWISRTRGTDIAAARARSRSAASSARGSTCTTTSLPGSARFELRLDPVRDRVALTDRRPGGTEMTTSANVRPAAWRRRSRES